MNLRTSLVLAVSVAVSASAQNKKDDIAVDQLPAEVKSVLEQYVALLRAAPDAPAAGKELVKIAGGGLVSPDGNALRADVVEHSLKKDHDAIKLYADPVEITRVNKTNSGAQGFGASAIKGTMYKIWIGKKQGEAGKPAPISILVPEGHASIKTPKVVNIGSL
jgi:hypothetical protein